MGSFWAEFLKSAAASTALVTALALLTTTIGTHWLSRDLAAFKARRETQAAVPLERLRPDIAAILMGVLVSYACSGDRVGQPSGNPSASPTVSPSVSASASGEPFLGVHDLKYYVFGTSGGSITTDAVTTQTSGSTIIVGVGRGDNSAQATPTDNKSNDYTQLGTSHTYTNWPDSGTALYASQIARGGAGHQVTVDHQSGDETTLVMVEVRNGGQVKDHKWKEVRSGRSLTSESVTTTGPAVLIAFWFGDAGVSQQTAVPNNGFEVLESLLIGQPIVQVAVAMKKVPGAGTYDVTWTATPQQGAQLYLVAVQVSVANP
jgi:hypothetical protein